MKYFMRFISAKQRPGAHLALTFCKQARQRYLFCKAGNAMFLILAIVLVLLWVGGFFMFHIAGGFIHILIILAVISLVIHLLTGRRA
jgi:uncharacterized membrane protein